MSTITVPGVYDIPEAEYHADPVEGGSLSSTTARLLTPPSTPALARYALDNPQPKDAYDLGSVAHALILGKGTQIVEVVADDWRSKAAKDLRDEARADGKVALLTKDLSRARAMADAVHADPIASRVLTGITPELTLAWHDPDTGLWGRAMTDGWTPPDIAVPRIVDVKTTEDPAPRGFAKSVASYAYHQQAAHYSDGYHALTGVWPAFLFVAVGKQPPHFVYVYQLDDAAMAAGFEANRAAWDVWRQCRETGEWPAGNDQIHTLSLPRWAS